MPKGYGYGKKGKEKSMQDKNKMIASKKKSNRKKKSKKA
jgi:hypothetical protein